MSMLSFFEDLANGIEARLAQGNSPTVARKTLALETARLGARLYSGQGSMAWCGVLAPFDLLNALGVTSCFVEFVGAQLASTGSVEPMLETAEQSGWSTDSCSYHRGVMGAALQGLVPEPDFLVGTSAPCMGGLGVIEALADHFGKDLFILTIPNREDDEAVDFLANQYREMVDFVVRHTGRPLDPARLRQAVELTNEARDLILEITQLAQHVPSPARKRDLADFALITSLFFGTPAAVTVAGAYRDEFARKNRDGVAGIKDEKVRLMWLQNRLQFNNPLVDLLADEHQAAVVIDEFNDCTWEAIDPDDPYRGMAMRTLSNPLTGSVQRRIENLKRLARDYKVDGAINPCQWGCRQGTGARGLIEAGMREAEVPVLNLEVDCVDPRPFSEGQLKTRIQAFIEMLDDGR